MSEFHCPIGAPFQGEFPCIECGLCSATTREEMVEASKKIRAYLRSPDRVRRNFSSKIAICGKGGTGKSTVLALLANALDEEGKAVLVVDTDESNPGLYRMFGFDKKPKPLMALLSRFSFDEPKPNTEWLMREEIAIQDIPSEYILDSAGLKFLMVGKIEDPFQGCACTMADVVRDFMGKLVLGENEIVLLDMEAGIESFGRGVERNVDTVLVVVEPSFESLALAEKISYLADGIGVNRVNAILNKVSSDEKEVRMKTDLLRKGIRPIGTIWYHSQISEAGFEGKAIFDLNDSKITESVKKIARRLLEEPD